MHKVDTIERVLNAFVQLGEYNHYIGTCSAKEVPFPVMFIVILEP